MSRFQRSETVDVTFSAFVTFSALQTNPALHQLTWLKLTGKQ
jgi:hypothetical protein